MSDQNCWTGTGRLGGTPEVNHVGEKQTAVVQVNLAVAGGWGANERTDWIGLKVWGAQAESLARMAPKGTKIWVQGELQQEEWNDKQTGEKRRKTMVNVRQWGFCESRKQPGDADPAGSSAAGGGSPAVDDGDDIPF